MHHHVRHFEHRFRDALEHGDHRLAEFFRDRLQAEAEQDREEDHRQQVAFRHRSEDIVRNHAEQEGHQSVMALHLLGHLLIAGNVGMAELRHIRAHARLQHVAEHKAEQDRDRGDHLEVDQRLQADAPERFAVSHASDPDHHAGEYDRHDNHLDQLDEDVAGGL